MRRRILWSNALVLGVVTALVGATSAPAAAREPILDATDAVLTVPPDPITRTLSPVQGCQVLLDTGDGDCAVVRTANGDLVVTVEPGPRVDDVLASRPWTVRVYRPSTDVPDGWRVALSTSPADGDAGSVYAGVTAKAVDVTGDGHDELVVGYRSEGTGMILDVDIVATEVDGTPRVLAHDQLYKGNVVFRHGRLVSYTPVYEKADANCCPKWIRRDVFRYRDGRIRVDHGPRLRARGADVPASELG
jgi:hypothetical protein